MDSSWWLDTKPEFEGTRWCHQQCAGTNRLLPPAFVNSGAAAIELAAQAGAPRVTLLGYDMGYAPDGQRHWHEDHTGTGGNAGAIEKWPRLFENLAPRLKGVTVINASRRTALTMFERRTLEQELSDG